MKIFFLLINFVFTLANPVWADDFDPRKIYQKTSSAVVLVTGANPGNRFRSIGTGSIIRKDGLIITNAHVILNSKRNKPYQNLWVYLKPKRLIGDVKKDMTLRFRTDLIAYSKGWDLAILKISKADSLQAMPSLPFADSDETRIGEKVIAIGHPEQGGFWSLTTGTISTQIRNFQSIRGKHVFQTETSINKGNSGGPLIDRKGRIVGINSNLARKGKDGTAITDINFAIKSNVVIDWLSSIGYLPETRMAKVVDGPKVANQPEDAGIVPVPNEKPKQEMLEDQVLAEKKTLPKPRVLSKLGPYHYKNLFQSVENEMENMMAEMKTRIRSKVR